MKINGKWNSTLEKYGRLWLRNNEDEETNYMDVDGEKYLEYNQLKLSCIL